MKELERSYDITLEAMGDASTSATPKTEGHSKRVTAYTIALAGLWAFRTGASSTHRTRRLPARHRQDRHTGPHPAQARQTRRRREEIMREHCERGYEMVRKIPFLRDAAEIVYAHQERFDGTGYPRGLQGKRSR